MTIHKLFGKTGAYSPAFIQAHIIDKLPKRVKDQLPEWKAELLLKSKKMGGSKLDIIHFDSVAQRHFDMVDRMASAKLAVQRLKAGFEIDAFQVPSVARERDTGVELVVDGANRMLLAAAIGADRVPVDRWETDAESARARIFRIVNRERKAMSSVISIRSMAVEDDQHAAKHLMDALDAAGVAATHDDFKGLDQLLKMLVIISYQPESDMEIAVEAMTSGLSLYRDVWEDGIKIDQSIAAAMAWLYFTHPELDEDEHRQWLVEYIQNWVHAPSDLTAEVVEDVQALQKSGASHSHGPVRIMAIANRLHMVLWGMLHNEGGELSEDDYDPAPQPKKAPKEPKTKLTPVTTIVPEDAGQDEPEAVEPAPEPKKALPSKVEALKRATRKQAERMAEPA